MTHHPVRWGFLGAGWVATRGMAPAVHAAEHAVLHAVASREPERSRLLGPARVHATYADLLDDDEIDVVYISLRNGQHREWVERSLAAGKHVLCEKPLGLDADEARSMFATADRHSRLLVEAVWAQWHPRFRRLADLVRSRSIGTVSQFDSAFTFTSDSLEGNYRLDPAMGGGALLDVGCYQIHAWVALLDGARDVRLDDVQRTIGPSGVDLTTAVRARIGTGVSASMRCSFVEDSTQALRIVGSGGEVRMGTGEAFTSWREPSSLWVGSTEEHFAPVDAFEEMTEAVSLRVLGSDAWVADAAQSIRAAELLDAIRTA